MKKSSNGVKVSLVGSGNIGGMLAYMLGSSGLVREITLVDVDEGFPKGKMLDIGQALTAMGVDVHMESSADYSAVKGSDAIVVTAGLPRKEGMSREDLLLTNAAVIGDVAKSIGRYAPDAFVIVVTNPLDAMVWHMHRCSGLPDNKVVGMAGILDSARFSFFLARHMNVSVSSVSSMVLGGHGDLMLPLLRHSTVGGVSVADLIESHRVSEADIKAIVERTRKGGEEIVKLFKKGSAFCAPAAACFAMLKSFIMDTRTILPCSSCLRGKYGVEDGLFVGVPVMIGSNGIEEVIEYSLSDNEKDAFSKSVELIKGSIAALS